MDWVILIEELVLASMAEEGKHLEDGKYKRRVAHERGEGRYQPVEELECNLAGFIHAVCAAD